MGVKWRAANMIIKSHLLFPCKIAIGIDLFAILPKAVNLPPYVFEQKF